MDPFAHSFTGAALSVAGLRKVTPLATAALVIGANAPDIDVVTAFMDTYLSLATRRGWTHGILAWAILPFLVTGFLMGWDALARRRRHPEWLPASPKRLLILSTIGVLSHPLLDWLNNYGIRLLMPFDDRWFYGDALFIIDPWVWLAMGGICFLLWSRSLTGKLLWLLFWTTASWLVLTNPLVPDLARAIWLMWLAALLFIRFRNVPDFSRQGQAAALASVVAVFTYMAANAGASAYARYQVKMQLSTEDIEAIMVGPVPANPFEGQVVIAIEEGYLLGSWYWLEKEKLVLDPDILPDNLDSATVISASNALSARRFLTWSRFPYASVDENSQEFSVSFHDARYAGLSRGIVGPKITLPKTSPD